MNNVFQQLHVMKFARFYAAVCFIFKIKIAREFILIN